MMDQHAAGRVPEACEEIKPDYVTASAAAAPLWPLPSTRPLPLLCSASPALAVLPGCRFAPEPSPPAAFAAVPARAWPEVLPHDDVPPATVGRPASFSRGIPRQGPILLTPRLPCHAP